MDSTCYKPPYLLHTRKVSYAAFTYHTEKSGVPTMELITNLSSRTPALHMVTAETVTTLYSVEGGREVILEWGIYLILTLLKLRFQEMLQPPSPLGRQQGEGH